MTDANGRATLVYTAPGSPSGSFDSNARVRIVVTPVGTDFGNTSARTVTIRLVPTGGVVPPDGLQPNFTPLDGTTFIDQQVIVFDASSSSSPLNNPDRVVHLGLRRRPGRQRPGGYAYLHQGRLVQRSD